MKKVLVTVTNYSKFCKSSKNYLQSSGFEIDENTSGKRYSEEQLIQLVPNYDAAIVGMDPWTDRVLQKANKMKIIAKFGVGYDNIDISSAAKKGISVTYARGENAQSVAELALTLILNVLKKVSVFNRHIRNGIWDRELQHELHGKTVGLYGFGNIAQALAHMLKGFDVHILAYDPYFNKSIADNLGVQFCQQEDLLRHSDVLSLHLPGFEENTHIIGKKELNQMKAGSILINTARGNLIDLDALAIHLQNEHILGAGLDCFETEPISKTHPIFEFENVVATPHCGGKTFEAYDRIGLSTAQNIIDMFNGITPKNIINAKEDK